MMKIVASLVILGLCANLAFGLAPVSSANGAAIATTALNNSFITTVLKGTNATDSAVWDSSVGASTGVTATSAGVLSSDTWFGPGATNDTSYLWGVPSSGVGEAVTTGGGSCGAAGASGCGYVYTVSSIRKRSISNTIVGWGNDTTQANVIADAPVTTSVYGDSRTAAVGPGYLAYLSTGLDTVATPNNQVWVTLIGGVSGSSATTKLTTTADVWESSGTVPAVNAQCTITTFTIGNIWYEQGAEAFFFTYSQKVQSAIATSTAGDCGAFTGTGSSVATKIYLGGIYLNGTAFWTTPISVAAATAGNTVSNLLVGGDNWLNATNIVIVYKDTTADIIYKSTTSKATTTTAVGAFSSLIADPAQTGTTTTVDVAYTPVSVWASNFTYGITVYAETTTVVTSPSSTTVAYTYSNFLNGSSTAVDSGLASTTTSYPAGYTGWQLNTGYSILSAYASQTSPYPVTYTLSNFYGNGTANGTSVTVGILSYSGAQFYQDVNGTMWIGWTDVDTANTPTYTYSAYLAKLQGQLNVPSGASILSALSAFVALFLAAIFVF